MVNWMSNIQICVVCDNSLEGFDSHYNLQLLSKGSVLSQKIGGDVAAICIGAYNENVFANLLDFGATKIIHCNSKEIDARNYANIIERVIIRERPKLIMLQSSIFSKEIAAILSTRLEIGLTADCVDILVDDSLEFIFERAALSDSILAQIKTINCQCSICTIKKGAFKEYYNHCNLSAASHIISEDVHHQEENSKIRILQKYKRKDKTSIDLSKTKVMFGIGRGIGEAENVKKIEALAQKCKAVVVGTRGVVEEGLLEVERQVGQSGISISPDIYVAFGISGASQHMVGLRNAKQIIAINKDKNAAIFKYANYSIITDVQNVIKTLEDLL